MTWASAETGMDWGLLADPAGSGRQILGMGCTWLSFLPSSPLRGAVPMSTKRRLEEEQ